MLKRPNFALNPSRTLIARGAGYLQVALWWVDRAAETPICELPVHGSGVGGVHFCRDDELWVLSTDGWLTAWDVKALIAWSERQTSEAPDEGELETPEERSAPEEGAPGAEHEFPEPRWRVRIEADVTVAVGCERFLAVGDRSGRVWLVESHGSEAHVRVGAERHTDAVVALAFSRNGLSLASSGRDRVLRIWRSADSEGLTEASLVGESEVLEFFSVAYDAASEPVDGGEEDEAEQSEADSSTSGPHAAPLRLERCLTGLEGWQVAVAYSPDGGRLASGGVDQGLYLWDLSDEQNDPGAIQFAHAGWIADLDWSRDGSVIATGSWDNSIGLFDGRTLEPLVCLELHRDYVCDVEFVGARLCAASHDREISIWNWADRKLDCVLVGHSDWVEAIAVLDDRRLLSVSSDRTTRVFDLDSGETAHVLGTRDALESFEVGSAVDMSAYVDLTGLASYEREQAASNSKYRDYRASGFRTTTEKTALGLLEGAIDAAPSVEFPEPDASFISESFAESSEAERLEDAEAEEAAETAEAPEPDEPVAQDEVEETPQVEEAPEPEKSASPDDVDEVSAQDEVDEVSDPDESAASDEAEEAPERDEPAAQDNAEEAAEPEEPTGEDEVEDGPEPEAPEAPAAQDDVDEAAVPDESVPEDEVEKPEVGEDGLAESTPAHFGRFNAESGTFTQPATPHDDGEGLAEPTPARLPRTERTEQQKAEIERVWRREPSIGTSTIRRIPPRGEGDEPVQASLTGPNEITAFESASESAEIPITMGLGDEPSERFETRELKAVQHEAIAEPPSTEMGGLDVDNMSEASVDDNWEELEQTVDSSVFRTHGWPNPIMEEDDHLPSQTGEWDVSLDESAASEEIPPIEVDSVASEVEIPSDFVPNRDEVTAELPADQVAALRARTDTVAPTEPEKIWESLPARELPRAEILFKRGQPGAVEFEFSHKIKTPHQFVYGVAVSPDGQRIATCGGDNSMCVWRRTGELLYRVRVAVDGLNTIDFSFDGRAIVAGGDEGIVHLWLLPEGDEPNVPIEHAQLMGHTAWISSVEFSGDGSFVLSGSYDGTVRVWKLSSGQCVRLLSGHEGAVSGVAVGTTRALSVGHDGSVCVWDQQWQRVDMLPGHDRLLGITTNGRAAAYCAADGEVFALRNGRPVALMQHRGQARRALVRGDGLILTAGEDGALRVYPPEMNVPTQALSVPVPLWSVDAEGDIAAAGADDGFVYVFTESEP